MQTFKRYPLLILFTALLLVTAVADMFVSRREFSEMENRYLEQKPKFSWSQLFKNEYTPKYERYVNDQFVGRDAWITLKSISESALLKIENNGIVYGGCKHMFEDYRAADERRLAQNIGFLGRYLEAYRGKANFTVAVIPNSYAVLSDYVPRGLGNVDQRARIGEIYAALPRDAARLDLFPAMEAAVADARRNSPESMPCAGDPVYYRTDHHWTTFGAYHAYRAFAGSRGLRAVEWGDLLPISSEVPGFYGSYYSKCKLFSAEPDTITRLDIPVDSVTVDGEEKPSLNDDALWDKRDKHAAFLWGNNGVTVLKSRNNLNHTDGETTRVLVIKDSYGNSFSPLLTYSYDEVYVVDLRSFTGKMGEFMEQNVFDDVLVLYNFMNFASDTNFFRLNG